jgi:hypothetical protein
MIPPSFHNPSGYTESVNRRPYAQEGVICLALKPRKIRGEKKGQAKRRHTYEVFM